MDDQETTECKYCGNPTPMLGTKLCDPWLESRIKANPAMAANFLIPDLLPARRPGTKLESEMAGTIAALQDDLHKANEIIKTLIKSLKENNLEIPRAGNK